MSNPAYPSRLFRRATKPQNQTLLRELFAATPLGILIAALKAMRQPTRH